ncbi:MAG TPA: TOBE domain-containing protein [Phenylobacterium sp.]|uniref:TOBE domain-containing protein n=1 Tax=Phenylobacterium sp. TaxID=1871053 RepID=UPI002B4A5D0A|nr:TOBE domain-containing protein [Phenylobacterium sp.]HKR88762.1 TOBE domain-containing protein [Phenylobacterium sp.]
MTPDELDVAVSLKRGLYPRVGLDRIALIEAVDDLGSITAAAKRLGLSYKGAWDIVQALNNLFAAPLIEAAPGGRSGGAATVTARGREVATAFRRVQDEIDAAVAKLEASFAGEAARDLFWSLGMRTSARNALRGEVSRMIDGAVNSEVGLKVADGVELTAILTRRSVADLGLALGKPAIALIKSSFVVLAKGEGLRTSARNQIAGVVTSREDGAVSSEISVDIGGGKTLTATVTLESAEALRIAVGDRVTALIKASHLILAVE